MTDRTTELLETNTDRLQRLRQDADCIRKLAARRMAQGATGLQIASTITEATDAYVVRCFVEACLSLTAAERESLERKSAVVAVGGTGRGDMAPYSDVDLLFLHDENPPVVYQKTVASCLRDLWDSNLKLGHSVRSVKDALRMASQDTQFATSLISTRLIWGSPTLLETLRHRFERRVIRRSRRQFIADCCASREKERFEHGAAVQQLEPDVKRSLGGLRDLHLMLWVAFARYGVSNVDSLRLAGGLSIEDSRRLVTAQEFLLAVRVNLHLAAGRSQDMLTRDDQLRIAGEREIAPTAGQRPVERFMQQYFEQSTAIAEISASFVARHRRDPLLHQWINFVMTYRVDDIFRVGPESLDVVARHRESETRTLEGILRIFLTASMHGVLPSSDLLELIKVQAAKLTDDPPTPEASRLFLAILSPPGKVGRVLRVMFSTGVLERVLPAMRHARCLLQFNQYHSYTVDEHTLRAVEAAEHFADDPGTLGTAYREIGHKELLHLALLLHDAGKGFEEDHSEIGKRLAAEAAQRLGLPEHQRDLLVFLVHRHLLMATLAFRRDTADPEVLLNFNHEVGSPEALRMLYVLTVADITAVGPGVWNDWKAELMAAFYDRSMVWLSGKSYLFEEPAQLRRVIADVIQAARVEGDVARAYAERLNAAPTHYLLATPAERISADLHIIAARTADEIAVEFHFDPETGTAEYRVITSENVGTGFFHKLTGAFSAKRMEILSALICTYPDGIIVDSYRVRDYDHEGPIPEFRRDEVAALIRRVLRGEVDVDTLFRARQRFSTHQTSSGPVSNLPLRIVTDNESSDRYTVIDVFAHDRPGLLYQIARTLFDLELSVVLAKISTHFDQVVDVFYVTDSHGKKIAVSSELKRIRDVLRERLEQFEDSSLAAHS